MTILPIVDRYLGRINLQTRMSLNSNNHDTGGSEPALLEELQINRLAHGLVTGVAGMEVVAAVVGW